MFTFAGSGAIVVQLAAAAADEGKVKAAFDARFGSEEVALVRLGDSHYPKSVACSPSACNSTSQSPPTDDDCKQEGLGLFDRDNVCCPYCEHPLYVKYYNDLGLYHLNVAQYRLDTARYLAGECDVRMRVW